MPVQAMNEDNAVMGDQKGAQMRGEIDCLLKIDLFTVR